MSIVCPESFVFKNKLFYDKLNILCETDPEILASK